jgi:hypothetical protein
MHVLDLEIAQLIAPETAPESDQQKGEITLLLQQSLLIT